MFGPTTWSAEDIFSDPDDLAAAGITVAPHRPALVAIGDICAAQRRAGVTAKGAGGYPGMTAGQIHEAALQREWNADAALRREFAGNFGAYKAYVAAKADGRVKVYGLGAVVR